MIQHTNYRIVTLTFTLLVASACENKFSKMPQDELEKKYAECQQVKNPQPGTAIACENILKEFNSRMEK